MKCSKCGYVRKAEDLAPEWQCPACQVVYAKASSIGNDLPDYPSPVMNRHQTKDQKSAGGPSLKTIVTLGLVAFFGYGAYHFLGGVTITRETPDNIDTGSPTAATDKTVLLYSRSGCQYCDQAREFLRKHNITYEEIDVNTSERGKEDFAKMGAAGVPVLDVAGSKIVGFDEGEITSVLKAKGLWQ